MSNMSEQQKMALRDIFAILNKNNTGTITMDDLDAVMQHLGRRPSQDELRDMLSAVDAEGSGSVDFDRFCSIIMKAEREEQLQEAFHRFDTDGDGVLSPEELQQALEDTLEELPDMATVQAMMQEADPNGSGHISYANFIQMALKYQKND